MKVNEIPWYRTPVDRDTLKALTVRSDLRGLLRSCSILGIYLSSVSLALFFFLRGLWVPMIAACYAHSLFHGFVGMEAAVHELSHGTPFKSKKLNEFFHYLFSFLSWNNPVHFRVSHARHHQVTLFAGRDKEVVLAPISFTVLDLLSWFAFDFRKFRKYMFPNIAHAFGRGDRDFFFWDPLFPEGDPRRNEMCRWARVMLAGHILLFAVFVLFRLWVLIYLVNFGYFFATVLSKGCILQQHTGLAPNVPDWRVSAHTVLFNPVLRYLYWNMNYHREHHMYAAVPFFNLPKLHGLVCPDAPPPVRGYLAGLRRLWEIRRRQKADPDYRFVPDFPPGARPPHFLR